MKPTWLALVASALGCTSLQHDLVVDSVSETRRVVSRHQDSALIVQSASTGVALLLPIRDDERAQLFLTEAELILGLARTIDEEVSPNFPIEHRVSHFYHDAGRERATRWLGEACPRFGQTADGDTPFVDVDGMKEVDGRRVHATVLGTLRACFEPGTATDAQYLWILLLGQHELALLRPGGARSTALYYDLSRAAAYLDFAMAVEAAQPGLAERALLTPGTVGAAALGRALANHIIEQHGAPAQLPRTDPDALARARQAYGARQWLNLMRDLIRDRPLTGPEARGRLESGDWGVPEGAEDGPGPLPVLLRGLARAYYLGIARRDYNQAMRPL